MTHSSDLTNGASLEDCLTNVLALVRIKINSDRMQEHENLLLYRKVNIYALGFYF